MCELGGKSNIRTDHVPARRMMLGSFVEPLFSLRSYVSLTQAKLRRLQKPWRMQPGTYIVVKLMAPVSKRLRMKAWPLG